MAKKTAKSATMVRMTVLIITFPCGINLYLISYRSEEAALQELPQPLNARRIPANVNNMPDLEHFLNTNDLLASMEARLAALKEELDNVNRQLEDHAIHCRQSFRQTSFSRLSENQLRRLQGTVDDLISRVAQRIQELRLREQAQTEGAGMGASEATGHVAVSSSDSTEGGDAEEDDFNAE